MDIAFWILSVITVAGAALAVSLRNVVHCVLSVILFFFGIAGHYFLLRADFMAAVQILLYVGAVAVLMLFAIMLTRQVTGTEGPRELGGKWWAGMITAGLLGVLVWWLIRGDQLLAPLPPAGPRAVTSVADIGRALVSDWVVPLEAMAVLLTAALIGAVVIALEEVIRRR
jgi:NADH-quinone oxidoreductase subunit J